MFRLFVFLLLIGLFACNEEGIVSPKEDLSKLENGSQLNTVEVSPKLDDPLSERDYYET